MMRRREFIKGGAALAPLCMAESMKAKVAGDDVTADTVYELRVYHLAEGKLPLILERFRSREREIFARHGMTNIVFWTPTETVPPSDEPGRTLTYIVRHASRETAKANWAAFSSDPEWVKLKAETEKDGAFVIRRESTFLKLTDFFAEALGARAASPMMAGEGNLCVQDLVCRLSFL